MKPDQVRQEFEDAKRQWDAERADLMLQIKRLEADLAAAIKELDS